MAVCTLGTTGRLLLQQGSWLTGLPEMLTRKPRCVGAGLLCVFHVDLSLPSPHVLKQGCKSFA